MQLAQSTPDRQEPIGVMREIHLLERTALSGCAEQKTTAGVVNDRNRNIQELKVVLPQFDECSMTSLSKIVVMELSDHTTIEMIEFEHIRAAAIHTQNAPAPRSPATLLYDRCKAEFDSLF